MSKKILLKNTVIYSIGEILPKIISFFLLPVFTVYLTTNDYGIISYTNAIMFVLLIISSLSLNTYLLRSYYLTDDVLEREKLIGNIFTVILIFNIFLLIVSFIVGPFIVKCSSLKIPFYPYFSLSLLNNFFEIFSIVPLIIFRVKGNAISYVLVNSSRALLLFIITYLLIAHFGWGVMGNFYGRLIVNGFFSIIYILIILKHSKINLNFEILKKALKFSLPLIPGSIGFLLMNMSDRIILERYVSLSDIGVYSVANTIAFSLSIIIQGAYRSFEPEIFKEYGKENFKTFLEKLHGIFMTIVLGLSICLALFANEILIFMTNDDFVKGYVLIPIILVGIISMAQNTVYGTILIAENKTKISSYATIAGGIISILFNIFLIPHFGIYSAAFATSIAYFVMNIIVIKGITLKVNFIKNDIYSMLYFLFICFLLNSFFGGNKILISILLYKVIILFISIFLLTKFYNLNQNYIKVLNSIFKKEKL
jgi:O-antigen/teichoic acid export membrane protein